MSDSAPIPAKRGFDLIDAAILAALGALIYGVIAVAREWGGQLQPVADIHLEVKYLPLYTFFSLTRGVAAYVVSVLFTFAYAYTAARVRGAERYMLPVLDILQSIPVLGFLPSFVLGLVHLFPRQNLGLEMASVLMIFTGQVWNMTFSLYGSLKSLPEDLIAVARLSKLSRWQQFLRLELPYAAPGLMWNSMMSMAGGWFFLTVAEAFVLGSHDFRLPGLGSYMSLAMERGDGRAQIMGIVAMVAMIVFLDQLVWRPALAWSQKFSAEEGEGRSADDSWFWNRIGRSRFWQALTRLRPAWLRSRVPAAAPSTPVQASSKLRHRFPLRFAWIALQSALLLTVAYAAFRYLALLRDLRLADWGNILVSTGATFGRVMIAVALASLWAVPVGVAIGRNPRLSRILKPINQVLASFPAPMLFQLVIGVVIALGGGLGIGSIFLLLLGTQWYVLFNVIAGASGIPKELWEVAQLGRWSLAARWKKLILPGVFPSLVTGWITATGGAWNASIVAEYLPYHGKTLTTVGLGALISEATDKGQFHLLAAAVGVMALLVVSFNRLVWRPLSALAQNRYSLSV